MMHSLILLPLAFFAFSYAASETNISVQYKLECDGQSAFNYNIKLMEADILSDDTLGEVNGAGRRISEGVLAGKDNGDGDSTYELYAYITHNCGGEGKTRRIDLNPMCEVGIARCAYVMNAKL